MKTLLTFLSFILIIGSVIFFLGPTLTFKVNQITSLTICDKPIRYKIGTIDPQFGLSEAQFKANIESARKIWAIPVQKKLFELDNDAKLTINLVFDERQALNNRINKLQGELDKKEGSIKPSLADFERKSSEFKSKVEILNKEIEDWNSKGGAPPDEYEKLIQRQAEIKEELRQLNKIADELNQSTSDFNQEVGVLNQTIGTFNQAIAQKPEEGIYDPLKNRIEIYFNTDNNEFIHTIAHEFGHALGLNHIDDKNAIMYSYTSKKINPTKEELTNLNLVCQENLITYELQNKLKNVVLYFQGQSLSTN